MLFPLFALVVGASLANSLPEEPHELVARGSVKCISAGRIGRAIRTIHASSTSQGAAFCSSFLPITTHTQVTVVRPTITKTDVVYTSTVTHTAVTVTKTAKVSSCITAANVAHKRDVTTASSVPTPDPLTSLPLSQVTRVCKCLNLPTSTVTSTSTTGKAVDTTVTISSVTTIGGKKPVTSTITTTATVNTCAIPTTCGNEGLQYAVFNSPYAPGASPGPTANFSADFDTMYLKAPSVGGEGPTLFNYSSTTVYAGGLTEVNDQQYFHTYGAPQLTDGLKVILDHRGYLYAHVAGTYAFQFTNADDLSLLWVGPTALTGWTRSNAALAAFYTGGQQNEAGRFTIALTAGEYLPYRVVFGNAGGPWSFFVSIFNATGDVVLDNSSEGNYQIVTHSCNNKEAPPFPYAFGYEQ